MKIFVTGADGFIGKNLCTRLSEIDGYVVVPFGRNCNKEHLKDLLNDVDVVVHLAGENRPSNVSDFITGNIDFTKKLVDAISANSNKISVIFASSIHAELDTPYGRSKFKAEKILEKMVGKNNISLFIYRLPSIFGKWAKPYYNSVVATFCYNIANDLPVEIIEGDKKIRLGYIDDLIDCFFEDFMNFESGSLRWRMVNEYSITVKELSNKLKSYSLGRQELFIDRVGNDFDRALYSTFISYMPVNNFSYTLPINIDDRGIFAEVLKTSDSGQISFFTAHPGITRGGHYHHTKTEKFLVVKGIAKFRFRNINTEELYEIETSSKVPTIVESIPGWAHDIQNIGQSEMIVILWSNEIFDQKKPDTIHKKL